MTILSQTVRSGVFTGFIPVQCTVWHAWKDRNAVYLTHRIHIQQTTNTIKVAITGNLAVTLRIFPVTTVTANSRYGAVAMVELLLPLRNGFNGRDGRYEVPGCHKGHDWYMRTSLGSG